MLKWIRSRVIGTKFVTVNPGVISDPRELKGEDRETIRQWLAMPSTKLVLGLMEARRPSVFISNSGPSISDNFAAQAATNRLHQIQGWESFRNTLLNLGREPEEIKQIVETFSEQ